MSGHPDAPVDEVAAVNGQDADWRRSIHERFDPHEDVVWYDTIAGAFDPEPDLGYHPGED